MLNRTLKPVLLFFFFSFLFCYLFFYLLVQRNTVALDEDQPRELEKALVLQDAISDLPPVRT